jgi:hypothetical protein
MEMGCVYREEGTELMCIYIYIYMYIIWMQFVLKRIKLCLLHYDDGYNKVTRLKLALCLVKPHAMKA